MTAEGGALVSHQVVENSTEKGRYIVNCRKKVWTKISAFLKFVMKTLYRDFLGGLKNLPARLTSRNKKKAK